MSPERVAGVLGGRRRVGLAAVVVVLVVGLAAVLFVGGGGAAAPEETSFNLRADAVERLQENGATALARRVDETLLDYAAANHTRRGPFETDAAIARETDDRAVARSLARSDDVLASAALRDARRARAMLDRRGTVYDRDRVTALVDEAAADLRAGRSARAGDPVAAIERYESAWSTARKALAVMDEAASPRARLTTRGDPGLGRNRTLVGTLSDVRVGPDQRVTIAIGETTRTVRVQARPVPLRNGTFRAIIRVPDEPTTVAVYPGDGTSGEPTDRLRLDGDGLPPHVERREGLDPLDPDTDGDGQSDGRERLTVATSNESIGANVTATGAGRQVHDLSVRAADPSSYGRVIDQRRVSRVVTVDGPSEVPVGRVWLDYVGMGVENESAITVYRRADGSRVFRAVPTTVYEGNDTAVARVDGFSSFVALAQSDEGGDGSDGTNRYKEFFSRLDRPFVEDLDGLVVHRELGPEGPQVLLYIQRAEGFISQSKRYTFGTIEFEDANVTSVQNGPRGLHPFEQEGNGRPEPGATERNGGGDEVHVLDDGTRIDFASKNDPFKDAFAFRYNVTGPNPRMRVTFRRADGTEEVVRLGGDETATVPAGQPIELPKLRDPDEDGLPTFIEEAGMITGDGRIIQTNATNNDTDGDGTLDDAEMGEPIFDDSAPVSPYFNPTSDPTDPNSDDVGLNDTQEYARGSDPWTQEQSLIYASLPVEADDGGIEKISIGAGGPYRVIRTADTYTHTAGNSATPPPWLKQAYEASHNGPFPSGSKDQAKYALVDTKVRVGVENASATPFDITYSTSFPSSSVVAVGGRPAFRDDDAYSFGRRAALGPGTNVVSVVVRQDDFGTNNLELGRLSYEIRRPNESVFYRPGRDQRTTINGDDYVVTSGRFANEYAFINYGTNDILRIYDESLGRVAKTAISAVALSVGGQTGRGAQILIRTGAASAGPVTAGAVVAETLSVACTATNKQTYIKEAKAVCSNEPPAKQADAAAPAGKLPEDTENRRHAVRLTTRGGRQVYQTAQGNKISKIEVGVVILRAN